MTDIPKGPENNEERLSKRFIDESYRMDDNSNLSEIARLEGEDLNDDLIPGVGVEE
ncbi:MAG: hypothetical protein LIO93_12315 [Bacteroidales bacterium]|nr:hypothetical protein [Bacteroidales bacterium]